MTDIRLSKDWSWLRWRNDDNRNRKLVGAIKSVIGVLFLICIGGNIFIGLLNLINQDSSSQSLLTNIAIPSVFYWALVIIMMAHMNKKYWAPSIDADHQLRKALGKKYDIQLDKQLETKSLKNLLDENWFVRIYTHKIGADTSSGTDLGQQ